MSALRSLYRAAWLDTAGKVAMLEVAVVLGTTLAASHRAAPVAINLAGYAALVVTAGAYALSRRWPLAAVLVALIGLTAYFGAGYPTDGPMPLGLMVTLYAFTAPDRMWRSAVVGAACVGVVIIAQTAGSDHGQFNLGAFGIVPWLTAALLLGHLLKGRRAERERLAARLREEHAERRVTEERLRIARELHDVVSHSISVINVQAGVAAHVLEEQPEQARAALLAIKATSKEALRELRGILGVLRRVDEAEPMAPAPGLAQLDVLVETVNQAGLPTRLAVRGSERPLSPAVDLAAYRIVQESLTNALRHAGLASAAVEIAYDEAAISIEVTDDGRGRGDADGDGAGQGIAGMHERAAAVGGELEAGPRPSRGFRVLARLPLA